MTSEADMTINLDIGCPLSLAQVHHVQPGFLPHRWHRKPASICCVTVQLRHTGSARDIVSGLRVFWLAQGTEYSDSDFSRLCAIEESSYGVGQQLPFADNSERGGAVYQCPGPVPWEKQKQKPLNRCRGRRIQYLSARNAPRDT